MVDTYGAHESRVYFVQESEYGVTPSNPVMVGINSQGVEPGLDPGLIPIRGIGSRDLQSLTKGLQRVALKIPTALTSESPIAFIQHVQTLNPLSLEVLYYKGLFSSPTDVISFLYKGCRIDKLSVECHIEDVLKAAVELIGQDVELGTAKIGASYGDYGGAVPYHDSYVQRGDPDGSNLAAIERVTDWKFNIENNLKPTGVIRSQLGNSSNMDANANSGQKVVSVVSVSGFSVGQKVQIKDDNGSEVNWIASIDGVGNDLTMKNNLVNNYTTAANGKVTVLIDFIRLLPLRHRNLYGELIFEFESKAEYDDVIQDKEFSLKFGLGGNYSALFKYCKWKDVSTPTRIEDLVSLKAVFVARDVYIS